MLPIRIATCRLVGPRCCWLLALILGGVIVNRGQADPVRGLGVDAFRALIDPRSLLDSPRGMDTINGKGLYSYLRSLHGAATNPKKLPSFADVAEVLLLPEWESDGFSIGAPVPLDQVERVVSDAMSKGDYEAFERETRKLIEKARANNNVDGLRRAFIAEIKHQSRLALLNRLKNGIRSALHAQSASSRIAAANLIRDIMMRISRRQEFARLLMNNNPRGGGKVASPSTVRNLPQSLRELSGDVSQLLKDSNPQVQSAGLRGLSELGIPAKEMAGYCRPLIRSSQTDVVARRATADALAHMLEQMVIRVEEQGSFAESGLGEGSLGEGEWAIPYETIQQLLPVAALGLDDRDADVRARSLQGCHAAARLLDNLARDLSREPSREMARDTEDLSPKRRAALRQERSGRMNVFDATMRVVDQVLPKVTASASDPVPALCVEACRTLELFVLASQRMRRDSEKSKGETLPPARDDKLLPPPDEKLPPLGVRPRPGKRSSQWAATRPEQQAPRLLPPLVNRASSAPASAVTVERPVQLPDTPARASQHDVATAKKPGELRAGTITPASFVAQRMDDLGAPTPDPWPGAVEAMISRLKHQDYRVRLRAVDVLETMEDRAVPAIPALVERLCDTNKFVRWGSARTLGSFAKRREDKSDPFYAQYADKVVTGLIGLLNDQEDPSVRITAAYAIEQYGERAGKAVSHLARVINRGDRDYILAILRAIQGIGTDAAPALPNVAWVLSDRTQPASVRIEAAKTLGMFGELARKQPRVMSVLREVQVNETDPDVRDAASTALLAIESAK